MNVQLVSDLHLDWGDIHLPGGDILVMAGDVFEVRHINKGGKMLDQYLRFCHQELSKYNHVIYVLGNHEYYGGHYDRTKRQIQTILPPNCHLLDCEEVILNNTRFWGGTLWTDFNRGNPLVMSAAQQDMNDYHEVKWNHKPGAYWTNKFTPYDVYQVHNSSVTNLKHHLTNPTPLVVVTHHAPTHLSTDGRGISDYFYYSDLSNLILDNPHITHWCHGHTHTPHDYNVGTTRVICNPRGYPGYERKTTYLPQML